ncbi:serine carboxypeptidase-like 51 [Tripterygium wilfordii]|uniref:serine carboxypeptidase-like 51 n=1 Tax=Tripterygium wilfordii TaxID=458696 RepID=UPI0018F7F6B6|nr:serine carboxypeptidase-like 51 [Tripterygium wilfordii]
MEKHFPFCLFLVFSFTLQYSYTTIATRTTTWSQGFEHWGYVQVLTNVHLYWWHFKSSIRDEDPSTPWPTILWLQEGPGGLRVALGNFLEIGPLDGHLQPRHYTWLRKADLLFVDNPAGTGFSYVEDETLFTTSDERAATELLFLLEDLFNRFEFLQESSLYIIGESYRRKIIVTLGLAIAVPRRNFATRTTTGGEKFERWGYVEVLKGVHLFWWHFMSPFRVNNPSTPWPTVLWLQGGPGISAVASGNFIEIGPVDEHLRFRRYTWLRKVDLLFVDSPAGTGFSYVEDEALLATSEERVATELLFLLKDLFNRFEFLQESSLYIFGESYGGKIAVTLGLAIVEAIDANELTLKLGGVVLGDSWISPEDFVFSWGPLLKDMSRLDDSGLNKSNDSAQKIKHHLEKHEYKEATSTLFELRNRILKHSNNVDFYNLLLDHGTMKINVDMFRLMNGRIRSKLGIIPTNVRWEDQIERFREALSEDYMKPRIKEVDQLLTKGVSVTVYNGQLDLICSTKGTEAWVKKLSWNGLKSYLNLERDPLYCGNDMTITKGFRRKYDNFTFYWILMSGHNIPLFQPCIALQMVAEITKSPSPH